MRAVPLPTANVCVAPNLNFSRHREFASAGWVEAVQHKRLTSIPQRIDHSRECRGGLAAARVVKVIARERRAPLVKDADEFSLRDVRQSHILGNVSQAVPGKACLENLAACC